MVIYHRLSKDPSHPPSREHQSPCQSAPGGCWDLEQCCVSPPPAEGLRVQGAWALPPEPCGLEAAPEEGTEQAFCCSSLETMC